MPPPTDAEYFELGDVTLAHGATLRGARLAYKTYGTLNADRSNAIVYPTWYSGEWFVIVPNMLGNGLSNAKRWSHHSDQQHPRL